MLLKLFKSNHPYVIFLIPFLGVALWIPSLFNIQLVNIQPVDLGNTTFAYNWLSGLLSFHPKAKFIFAFILLIIQSYILIRLNFKHIFIENRTYLPAVFFVLFSSILVSYQNLHPVLIANLFLLFAIEKSFVIDKERNKLKRYYESGLLLGFGTIFYPNIFVFLFIIWLTMFVLRTFNWREWMTSILGLITPLAFYVSYLYLTDNFQQKISEIPQIVFNTVKQIALSEIQVYVFSALGIIMFFMILGGIRLVGVKKINIRKYYWIFILFTLYVIGIFVFYPYIGYELIYVIAFPASIIFSTSFLEIRNKWIGEILFTIILAAVFAVIWM